MTLNFLIILILSIFFIYICNKKKILQSKSGDIHQNFIDTESTPLLGGIILFSIILINYSFNLDYFILFTFLILFIGIISDVKKNFSPNLRLFFQSIIILMSVYHFDNSIGFTNFYIIDLILANNYFKVLFTTFCILILINGTNFIDGTNLNVCGYYLAISISLFFLDDPFVLSYLKFQLIDFCVFLFVLFLLNSINKIYLGDSGSYILGFIFSFELINYFNQQDISPFYIILLLWYPCFELLFSIFRKLRDKKSPLKPDSKHLHHFFYENINKRFNNPMLASSLAGFFISIYNIGIFLVASINPYHTKFQIFLILANIFIYALVYHYYSKK